MISKRYEKGSILLTSHEAE
ncbi:hypothetical protein ABT294_21285 [Nonomuraea sp. NPDC000554]